MTDLLYSNGLRRQTLFLRRSLALIALWTIAVHASAKEPGIAELMAASSADLRRDATRDLFDGLASEKIRNLLFHENDGVALAAAWELVRRTITPRSVRSPVDPPVTEELDQVALQRFLGFIEGRLRVEIPEWWERRLRGSHADTRNLIIYLDFDHEAPARPKTSRREIFGKTLYVRLPGEQRIFSRGGSLVYRVKESDSIVPPDVVNCMEFKSLGDAMTSGASISGASIGDRRFILAHSGLDRSYKICSWVTGQVEADWCQTVWSEFPLVPGASGTGHIHYAGIMPTSDVVYIFGACQYSFYIEAFAQADGKPVMRFSTSY